MAEAFFNKMSKSHRAVSGGVMSKEKGSSGKKVGSERPNTSRVMKEMGYDISDNVSKEVTKEQIDGVDMIIYMRDETLTRALIHNNKKVIFWDDLPNPNSRNYEYIYSLGEAIREKVEKLVVELEPHV